MPETAATCSGNLPLKNSPTYFRLHRNSKVLSLPRRFSTLRTGTRFESKIGPSVSKASRFLRALSHPGLASRTAGESQREPPSGWQVRSPGCCGWLWMPPQGCTCVSISQAPSWPRVSAAEIVRALAVHFHSGAAGPSLYLFASPSFPWYGMKHSRHWEV